MQQGCSFSVCKALQDEATERIWQMSDQRAQGIVKLRLYPIIKAGTLSGSSFPKQVGDTLISSL
jgi:hypothetical protein